MIDFTLSRILQRAPYDITLSESRFIFETDTNIHYVVSFDKEDMILGGCETYQLILQNVEHVRPPHDPKVQKTVLAIIDEFFRSNMKVLLYICDTSDGKEDSRNRLFLRWFEKYAEPGRFTICNAHANVEGEVVYAAIIVENRNPKLKEIMEDFEEAAAVLTDKP